LNHLPRVNDQEPIMFDVLMNLLVILSFGFPAVPWLFGARWGARGVWLRRDLPSSSHYVFFQHCFGLHAVPVGRAR